MISPSFAVIVALWRNKNIAFGEYLLSLFMDIDITNLPKVRLRQKTLEENIRSRRSKQIRRIAYWDTSRTK